MFERVKTILVEKLNIDKDKITMDTNFKNDLDIDSLTLFELIMAIEDEFDIEMEDDATDSINTVGDVVEYLKKTVK